jgi:hypothetical protein
MRATGSSSRESNGYYGKICKRVLGRDISLKSDTRFLNGKILDAVIIRGHWQDISRGHPAAFRECSAAGLLVRWGKQTPMAFFYEHASCDFVTVARLKQVPVLSGCTVAPVCAITGN